MELTDLRNKICGYFSGSQDELNRILEEVKNRPAVYPFSEYEFLLQILSSRGDITYDDYLQIRADYISKNPNLWTYEISAPRNFGEDFAQAYIQEKSDKILKASKDLDPNYKGQYDLWLNGIRIEVKASRACDSNSEDPLYRKALSATTTHEFHMNFQQLKPKCCDVFIWMAVYRDAIKLWVMNSNEVCTHSSFSKGQHRGNKGNEGQLHITKDNISSLDDYLLEDDDIVGAITKAYNRRPKP